METNIPDATDTIQVNRNLHFEQIADVCGINMDEIKSLNVKVNWKEAKKAAQPVNEGDVISFRGRGRVEIEEIRGTTKKGRISVTLKRYI